MKVMVKGCSNLLEVCGFVRRDTLTALLSMLIKRGTEQSAKMAYFGTLRFMRIGNPKLQRPPRVAMIYAENKAETTSLVHAFKFLCNICSEAAS